MRIRKLIDDLMQGYGNSIANAFEIRIECAPLYDVVLHIDTLGPFY